MKFPITLPAIRVEQPLGTFFLCNIPIDILSEVTIIRKTQISKIDTDRDQYTLSGTQREFDKKRKEIGKYINSVEASFPNTIILASNYDEEQKLVVAEEDNNASPKRWEVKPLYEESNDFVGELYLLTIPTSQKLASVIDGQHRLRGFDFADDERKQNFGLPCAVFLDLPVAYQALLFATINANQKKVDKSLAYELFGYNLDEEESKSWSPHKLSVFLTRKLNLDDESPLKGHIKTLAIDDQKLISDSAWSVSTAVLVDGITKLFSQKPKDDGDQLALLPIRERDRSSLSDDTSPLRSYYLNKNDLLIYTVVKNYFIAINNELFSSQTPKSYTFKTVGIQALFDVLLIIIKDALTSKDISSGYFSKYFSSLKGICFNDSFFQASGIGRNRIKNIILIKNKLKTIESINPNDLDDYKRILNV